MVASPQERNRDLASNQQDVVALSASCLHRHGETDGPALVIIIVVESPSVLHLVWGKPIVSQMGHNELYPVIVGGGAMHQHVFLYQLHRERLKFWKQ